MDTSKKPATLLHFEDGTKVALVGKKCTNISHVEGDENATEIYRRDGYQVLNSSRNNDGEDNSGGDDGNTQNEFRPHSIGNQGGRTNIASGGQREEGVTSPNSPLQQEQNRELVESGQRSSQSGGSGSGQPQGVRGQVHPNGGTGTNTGV